MVSNKLLEAAQKIYDFDKGTVHLINDGANKVYKFKKDEKYYILRFSKRPAEKIHETKAEMDWLYYLWSNNISVALPLKTNNGETVASAQDSGENYLITSFEMVSGQLLNTNDPNHWNQKAFFGWGRTMGDIHSASKNFKPANAKDVRSVFDGRFALEDIVKKHPSVNKIAEELIKEIMRLPKDKDSYGLIHNDMHPLNFHINRDKINVFDFDDALYGWFSLDIGIALYHGLLWGRKENGNELTNIIIENFIKGYLSGNHLSDFWLSKIPMFMKFRQICNFSWIFNPGNIDDKQKEFIHNIENGILFTDCNINYALFKI